MAMAMMSPPPDPQAEGMLSKLERLLTGKAAEDEKIAEEKRAVAEAAKFSRLETLLISQEEARRDKDEKKKKAAEEAARIAADAKRRGDEDKLAKLEKLILAQKDEQLKREAVAETARLAEKAAAEAEAAKSKPIRKPQLKQLRIYSKQPRKLERRRRRRRQRWPRKPRKHMRSNGRS